MYKRILLKLSGEALAPKTGKQNLDVDCLHNLAEVIKKLHDMNKEIAIVIGAGNIWRGKLADEIGIERVPADFMGMLGTVINAVALSSALNKLGVQTKVYSAIHEIPGVCDFYDKIDAKNNLSNGVVCFFAGGTGKPYFTTDTAATLRAIETECDAIFMGKYGVQGIYDKDPLKYADATFFPKITFKEIIAKNLQVMDISAVELIKDTDVELRVFSMEDANNFINVANGSTIGTTVRRTK